MKQLRILLVEDDASVSGVLAEVLDGVGHIVCGVEATEAGAVTAALTEKPDLMIVDVRLRRGSGIAAVETIYRAAAVIPHIFMTGDRSSVKRPTAIVLQKPFMNRDLVDAIERAFAAANAGSV